MENEQDEAAWKVVKRHFQKSADKVIKDAMYNARIAAVNYYYKKVKGQPMSKKKGRVRSTSQRSSTWRAMWIGFRRTWKPGGGWLRDGRRRSGLKSPRSTVPTVALKDRGTGTAPMDTLGPHAAW